MNIANGLKAKQNLSISDVFSDNLKLDEFIEYKDGGFNEGFQGNNKERGLFLNSIYTHKLSRRDGTEYAQLKILEQDGHLTEEQEQLLVDYNFFIESDPKSRDLKAMASNFAQTLGISTEELGSNFKTSILSRISERVKNTGKNKHKSKKTPPLSGRSFGILNGGRYKIRTYDPLRVKQVL